MATTKYLMAEQIMSLLNGGLEYANASKYHINEIKLSVEQMANQLLKMEYLSINVKTGEMIPNGASVATYENIPVVQYGSVSKSKLPCFPLKLPRGMGVHQIFAPATPDDLFIPLEMGMKNLIKNQPIINDLLGCTGFEVYGMDVIYTKDLTTVNNTTFVTMRLVVMDFTQYTDWDVLPLAPEQEWQIKNGVYQLYTGEPIPDKLVDPHVKEQRGVPVREQQQS